MLEQGRTLLHELLALIGRQLADRLSIGVLLHLERRVLRALLHVANRLVGANLAVVTLVGGLGVLLVLLLVVLIEGAMLGPLFLRAGVLAR